MDIDICCHLTPAEDACSCNQLQTTVITNILHRVSSPEAELSLSTDEVRTDVKTLSLTYYFRGFKSQLITLRVQG